MNKQTMRMHRLVQTKQQNFGFVTPINVTAPSGKGTGCTKFRGTTARRLDRRNATSWHPVTTKPCAFPCVNGVKEVRATATPVEVTESTFEEEVLASDVPVVVDFYAAWCGPCKLMTPLMDWAAAEFEGKVKVVKIDTEENDSFVKKYEIYGLPTFAVFVSGEARGLHEGAMTKVVFKDYIEKHAGFRA